MPQLKNTNVFIPTDVEPYNYLSIEDYVSSIVQYLEVYTQNAIKMSHSIYQL